MIYDEREETQIKGLHDEISRLRAQNIQLRDDYTSQKDHFEAQATRHYAQWAEQRQLISELVAWINKRKNKLHPMDAIYQVLKRIEDIK